MRILVGIANFGTKNRRFLDRVVAEYRKMERFTIDIVIFAEKAKDYGSDIEVVVGLPGRNTWTLPFAHKSYFAERVGQYDLFIYSEDDTLIQESHIEAFLRVSRLLPKDQIAGFVRYENGGDDTRYYTTMHAHFHWDANSVVRLGDHVFAHYRNEHSGCYVLTQDQLRRAIGSGGYLLPPRTTRYGFPETAATDPYTQCGLRKVICISHFSEFCIQHLPNAYWHYMGLPEACVTREIQNLLSDVPDTAPSGPLFRPDTLLGDSSWDKKYYEECREDIIRSVPPTVGTLLSVGCGCAATEAKLVGRGIDVTGIPMDRVIGATAEARGIRVLPPAIDTAFSVIRGQRFDCILLNDVLCHLPDPQELLGRLGEMLSVGGTVVVSTPNGGGIRKLRHRQASALMHAFSDSRRAYHYLRYHLAGLAQTRRWLILAGIEIDRVECEIPSWWDRLSRLTLGVFDHLVARRFLLICSVSGRGQCKFLPSKTMRESI